MTEALITKNIFQIQDLRLGDVSGAGKCLLKLVQGTCKATAKCGGPLGWLTLGRYFPQHFGNLLELHLSKTISTVLKVSVKTSSYLIIQSFSIFLAN